MDYKSIYEQWCTDSYFDEDTKAELKAIAGDEKEIEDRFYRTLEFGTAGLRGVIGAGTNRMNIYTVRQATQGLANYIVAQGGQERGYVTFHGLPPIYRRSGEYLPHRSQGNSRFY